VNEAATRAATRVVRILSLLVGAALAAWAFADDSLVGGGPGFGGSQATILAVGVAVAASTLLPLRWNGRVLALVVSTGFVLVVLEVALQILFAPRYKGENQFDAQLLYRPTPGAVVESSREAINGGDRIRYTIDSQGFRGPELQPKPAGRIAVYGDSFVHAYYSRDENTFARRLQEDVSKRLGEPIEVVNAGVAGYGPDQELLKLERELDLLQPDLVIVAVFSGNDFGDPVRNKLFRVDADGTLRENAFTVDPELKREMDVHRGESILKRIVRNAVKAALVSVGLRAPKSSNLETMTPMQRLEYFRDQHVREYDEFVVKGDDHVRELAWDSYDADVSLEPSSDSARYKIALMDGILARMQAATRKRGVPLVLVPIPHPLDLGHHETGAVDTAKYPDYRPRGLVDQLEGIAARHGIPFVDLYAAFQKKGSESLYFQGWDDHWNDAGQAYAAEVVTDRLAAEGLLEPLAKRAASSDGRR
jgi:hypothetical protein